MTGWLTKWTTRKIFVDMDTAEKITPKDAEEHYTVMGKNKKSILINHKKGITEITYKCRRIKQGKLW